MNMDDIFDKAYEQAWTSNEMVTRIKALEAENAELLEACKEMWLIMEEHPIYRAHASRLARVRATIRAAESSEWMDE